MIWLLILSVLAGFGVLCLLWTFLGFLLPGQKGLSMVYVCRGEPVDALLRRYRWLQDMGLIRGRLILVDAGIPEDQKKLLVERMNIEICTREQLADRVG